MEKKKWWWETFEGLKSQRKIIGGLKWKVWPFNGSKHIFNLKKPTTWIWFWQFSFDLYSVKK